MNHIKSAIERVFIILSTSFCMFSAVVPASANTTGYGLTGHLGNVRAVVSEDGADAGTDIDILSATDYYPGGMRLPNRWYVSENYRFGYQGQYAEHDQETGFHAFELRLYDSRINRFTSIDPYNQYWSSYMAMGNNWPNIIDPDGGWVKGAGFFTNLFRSDASIEAGYWNKDPNLYFDIDEVTITGKSGIELMMVKSPCGGMMLNPARFNYNPGTISQYVPNFFGRIEESTLGQTFVGKAVYGVVDDGYVYSTSFIYGPSGARHLNRSGVVGSELQDAGISTLTNFVPIGKMGSALGIGKKTLNAGQFNALYKGSGITAATGGGVQIRTYNQAIRTHTGFQKAFTWFGIGTTAVGATQK